GARRRGAAALRRRPDQRDRALPARGRPAGGQRAAELREGAQLREGRTGRTGRRGRAADRGGSCCSAVTPARTRPGRAAISTSTGSPTTTFAQNASTPR